MIIWKSKEYLENRKGFPCEKFRWVFEISLSSGKSGNNPFKNVILRKLYNLWQKIPYFYTGFIHQYKYPENNEWYSSRTLVYGVSITRHFKLGIEHLYYDGPHCSLSVGFLHFIWGGNPYNGWCKKCYDETMEN